MQFSALGQPWWFQWLWELTLACGQGGTSKFTHMWGRQSHPPQRTLGQSPSSTVRKVKGGRFYSGEELPKILICDMGVGGDGGWGFSTSVCPGSIDLDQEELGPIWTQSLEREKRSQGWEWSPVRSWGTLGRGRHTVSLHSNGHQV